MCILYTPLRVLRVPKFALFWLIFWPPQTLGLTRAWSMALLSIFESRG